MTVLGRQQAVIVGGTVIPGGGPLIGQEFFWIRDQTGVLWAWWISYDLAADWRPGPQQDFDQEVRFFEIPWWLKLADDEGQAWFVYPEVDGSPLLSITQPPTGDGLVGSPSLRVRGGPLRYMYAIEGGGLDVSLVVVPA